MATDANPDGAHPIGGEEISECTTFFERRLPENKGLDTHSIGYSCRLY